MFGGVRVIEDLLMIDYVEDWANSRSTGLSPTNAEGY